MKKLLCILLVFTCVIGAASCSLLQTPRREADEEVVVETTETPSPTPAPTQAPVIPQAIFDALCAPLGCISDAEDSGHYFYPGQLLSDDFINNYLYHYANRDLYPERQRHGVADFPAESESVMLTEEQLAGHMLSVFGPDMFDAGMFRPNDSSVVRKDGNYYILIGEVGPSSIAYSGEAPLPFDAEAEYDYTLTLYYPGNDTYVTDVKVQLAQNEQSQYGYSIVNVVFGGMKPMQQVQAAEESTLNGKWIAVENQSGEIAADDQWFLMISGYEAYEYINWQDYENGEYNALYPLEKQEDGSAHMMVGQVSTSGNVPEDFYAKLELLDSDTLRCTAYRDTFILKRDEGFDYGSPEDGPFDQNGFVFADSSNLLLDTAEVLAHTASFADYDQMDLLGFARNEIFARHGNQFEKEKYKNHYAQYEWYNSLSLHKVEQDELNEFEKANVAVILACEEIAQNSDAGGY